MYCKNCGKPNDEDSKFCMHCGQPLKQDAPTLVQATENISQTTQPIFQNQITVTEGARTDTGYFVIALLTLLNVSSWLAWTLTASNSITGNEALYKSIRVFTVLLLIGQFVVSLIFAKRQTYKIIIAIIGLLCTAYYIYYLIDDFKRF
jgi:hypothetical protein